ncbi:MAG: bifunctional hydroxymethylpyrimidine kinase/phosphomethylpyrimidine kinase [Tatlockia sp.]|nr:bifunctional hydroxymethylpyrimidine kinase/phosphomethylpyrimidine kinase [Tatlockia sp.]
MQRKVLSIAGFDGSGGAGIQADLKTFSAFGCYGMTVLTALPVQNTQGVKNCYELPLKAIEEQLEAIFEDIKPDSIKIGMLFKAEIVSLVASFLKTHAKKIPIILDPVLLAKSGDSLLLADALEILKAELIPLTTLITPNLPEAQALLGLDAQSEINMPLIAQQLLKLGSSAVLLKGGHLQDELHSNDFFLSQKGQSQWLTSARINSKNTHGTGCTLSAAIASGLALGLDLFASCELAKKYVYGAIEGAKDEKIGLGNGPVHHFYHLWPTMDKIF